MAQIAANPWLLTTADVATTVTITSIANNVDSILVTTSAGHGYTNPGYNPISIQGTTNYNGPYRILAVPSATTLLLKNRQQNYTTAAGGALGSIFSMVFLGPPIRCEQILWNQPGVAPGSLLLTDGWGNVVWNPSTSAANTSGMGYVYGKIYYIQNGLVLNTLVAGTVQLTIN